MYTYGWFMLIWQKPTELCKTIILQLKKNTIMRFYPTLIRMTMKNLIFWVFASVARMWRNWNPWLLLEGFPGGDCNAGDLRDTGSVPELGRSPGGGHGNPLQYSCLENPMDRGAWWATVRRVAKSRT